MKPAAQLDFMVQAFGVAVVSFGAAAHLFGAELPETLVNSGRATLGTPGPFSNVVYVSRSISLDGKTLSQEAFWILAGKWRVMRKQIPNEMNFVTIEEIAEEDWNQARLVFEVIRNEKGCFSREAEDPNWESQASRMHAQMVTQHPNAIEVLIPPHHWRPFHPSEPFYSGYTLSVGKEVDSEAQTAGGSFPTNRVMRALPYNGIFTNYVWELEYNQETRAKLAERAWASGSLVRECIWRYDVEIDPKQLELSAADIYEDFPKGTRLGGIGIRLHPGEKGPFVITAVLADSPAERAGLEVGDKLLSIMKEDTRTLSSGEVQALARGDPGTVVDVEIEKSQSKKIERLRLERALISASPSR